MVSRRTELGGLLVCKADHASDDDGEEESEDDEETQAPEPDRHAVEEGPEKRVFSDMANLSVSKVRGYCLRHAFLALNPGAWGLSFSVDNFPSRVIIVDQVKTCSREAKALTAVRSPLPQHVFAKSFYHQLVHSPGIHPRWAPQALMT